MAFYRYEAVDRAGKTVMGTMDAPTESEVTARLSQMGYEPQAVVPAPGTRARTTALPTPAAQPSSQSTRAGASAKDLAVFFRQFAALSRAGISLYQALDNLGPRTPQPALSRTAREMAEAAHSGGRISDVMEQYPRLFAPHVVATVRAGELGGFLEIALDEIALEYEQEIAFYKGMWIAYAAALQGLIAVAVAQPVFPDLFPPPSKWGLFAQHVFLRNIPILLGILFVGRLFYLRWRRPENAIRRDALMLRFPVFGDLARQRALAAFVRMLHKLFRAGIAPIGAWEGAMNVAPNAVVRAKLAEAYAMMQQGVPLHEAFSGTRLFANETENLLATGVMSGQMVDMLDRVADYYQGNVDRAFQNARFWMIRLAIALSIAISGAIVIVLAKTYFDAVFAYPHQLFPELDQ